MNDSETKARDRNLALVESLLPHQRRALHLDEIRGLLGREASPRRVIDAQRPVTPRGVVEVRRKKKYSGLDNVGDAWRAAFDLDDGTIDLELREDANGSLHVYTPTQARELASALNALADRIDGRG